MQKGEGEEEYQEQEGGLIPIYIAATVFGLLVLVCLVRMVIWLCRNIKASLPPHAREQVVALHQLVLVS